MDEIYYKTIKPEIHTKLVANHRNYIKRFVFLFGPRNDGPIASNAINLSKLIFLEI